MTRIALSQMVDGLIAVPLFVVWVVGVVDIVRGDLPARAKVGWIAVVLLLPFVGVILYFALRKPTKEQGMLRHEAAADLRGSRHGGSDRPPPPVG